MVSTDSEFNLKFKSEELDATTLKSKDVNRKILFKSMTTQSKAKDNCLTDGTNLLSTGKSNDLFLKTDVFDTEQIAFAHKVEYVHYSSARRDN